MNTWFFLSVLFIDPAVIQARLDQDTAAGKPLIAHVVVALVDNETQGVRPVPKMLGNGTDPRNNLYWGALYGVKTFMSKKAGWLRLAHEGPMPEGVLDRLVLTKTLERGGKPIQIYMVAEAWDGRQMENALYRFYDLVGGKTRETLGVKKGETSLTLTTAGDAHLTAFIGHNGMMDHDLLPGPEPPPRPVPASVVVLACLSKTYFYERLEEMDAYSLLLTNGLMAPEAYTLDGAVTAWFSGKTPSQVHEASAAAYHQYQKCGMKAARWLFFTEGR